MEIVFFFIILFFSMSTADEAWSSLGTFGGVTTYVKPDCLITRTKAVKGSKIFKNQHISGVLGVFSNATVAPEWVDMLKSMNEYPLVQDQCRGDTVFAKATLSAQRNPDTEVIHQVYNFPWPIQSRDFTLLRRFSFDAEKKEVEVYYESIQDDRVPISEQHIRGANIYSRFFFRKVVEGTWVEIETQVDLKGSLPSILINQVQKLWPMKTLNALEALVRKGSVPDLERVKSW